MSKKRKRPQAARCVLARQGCSAYRPRHEPSCMGGRDRPSPLKNPLPRRWAHTPGVAAQVRSLGPILGRDADLVEAAAWVHDIGYSPELIATGFHPLDGARSPGSRANRGDDRHPPARTRRLHRPPARQPQRRTRTPHSGPKARVHLVTDTASADHRSGASQASRPSVSRSSCAGFRGWRHRRRPRPGRRSALVRLLLAASGRPGPIRDRLARAR